MSELELNDHDPAWPLTTQLERLIDAIDAASDQDQVTWLTHDGRRVAAIVPVDVAEAHERGIAEVLATPVRHFTRTDTGRLG